MLLFQQHMFAVILLCALCALCGFCLFLRYLPSPNLAYELHNLKCGDMGKTFLYETVMVNRLQLMCPMADAEKTEIGDSGVLLQTGRQVAASSAGFTLIELIMVIVLIGIGALALLLWEPHVEGRNAHATLFEMEPGKSCEYLIFVHQDHQDLNLLPSR